jgi:hypothetical protein
MSVQKNISEYNGLILFVKRYRLRFWSVSDGHVSSQIKLFRVIEKYSFLWMLILCKFALKFHYLYPHGTMWNIPRPWSICTFNYFAAWVQQWHKDVWNSYSVLPLLHPSSDFLFIKSNQLLTRRKGIQLTQ